MKDSVVRASLSNGILTSGGTTLNFAVENSVLSGNAGNAIQSSGANSFVAVGNSTIFGNGATLGGHVTVEDFATISAYSGVHR